MTPEAQRIAIAEACGFTTEQQMDCPETWRIYPQVGTRHFYDTQTEAWMAAPDYLNDLNAMHAGLKAQTQAFRAEFDRLLRALAEEKHLLVTELEAKDWADCFISCLQSQRDSGRAEAFLRTIGKWVDL